MGDGGDGGMGLGGDAGIGADAAMGIMGLGPGDVGPGALGIGTADTGIGIGPGVGAIGPDTMGTLGIGQGVLGILGLNEGNMSPADAAIGVAPGEASGLGALGASIAEAFSANPVHTLNIAPVDMLTKIALMFAPYASVANTLTGRALGITGATNSNQAATTQGLNALGLNPSISANLGTGTLAGLASAALGMAPGVTSGTTTGLGVADLGGLSGLGLGLGSPSAGSSPGVSGGSSMGGMGSAGVGGPSLGGLGLGEGHGESGGGEGWQQLLDYIAYLQMQYGGPGAN